MSRQKAGAFGLQDLTLSVSVLRMLQDDVAANIRAELGRADRTQDDLARELGWTPAFLNRRLKGHVGISADEAAQIAAALGVPVDAIVPRLPKRKAG